MEFVDLTVDDSRLSEVFAVLHQLRDRITEDQFRSTYAAGWDEGLRFTAAYENNICIAVAGWRVMHTTSSLLKFHVDDLVTDTSQRSTGVGKRLFSHLEDKAKGLGCKTLELDSGVQKFGAHAFYLREGMHISAHHFAKALDS